MCETEVKTVFTYDELGPKAQERAREWLRELTASDFGDIHGRDIIAEFVTICGGLGIDIEWSDSQQTQRDVYWSLDYSQGNGASFDAVLRVCDATPGKVLDYLPADPKDDDSTNGRLRTAVGIASSMALAFPGGQVRYRSGATKARVLDPDAFYRHEGDVPDDATVEAMNDTFESQADDLGGHLSAYLYERLRDEHEYQSSDEALEETIRANGYEFDADGERV